jgi:hypothetical protein
MSWNGLIWRVCGCNLELVKGIDDEKDIQEFLNEKAV